MHSEKGGGLDIQMDVHLTIDQVEHMLDERDKRLEEKLAVMIKGELEPFKASMQDKASHSDVDAAITKAVDPVNDKVDRLFGKIDGLTTLVTAVTTQLAEVRGLATALTNMNGTQLDAVRERQTEMRQSIELLTSAKAGLLGDVGRLTERVNSIFEDVRGVPDGQDGSPSLFALTQMNGTQIGVLTTTLNAFIIESRGDRQKLRDDNAAIMRRVESLEKTFNDARAFAVNTVKGGVKRAVSLITGNPWKAGFVGAAFVAYVASNDPVVYAAVRHFLGLP